MLNKKNALKQAAQFQKENTCKEKKTKHKATNFKWVKSDFFYEII